MIEPGDKKAARRTEPERGEERSGPPRRWLTWSLFLGISLAGGAAGAFSTGTASGGDVKEVTVVARQYAYDPPVIHVNKGDTLKLRFASKDVVHGFYLEGHDLNVTIYPMRTKVEVRRPSDPESVEELEEVAVTVRKTGKFRYRCSRTCGFMHPFMLGELIVGPNRLLPASIGLAVGMLLGGFVTVRIGGSR